MKKRERLAYHEAGHTVIVKLFCGTVESVSIIADGKCAGSTVIPDDVEVDDVSQCVMSMAGKVAEHIARQPETAPTRRFRISKADFVRSLMIQGEGSDIFDAYEFAKDFHTGVPPLAIDAFVEYAAQYAKEYLLAHWQTVERLAQALSVRGKLDGDRLELMLIAQDARGTNSQQ